jgi:hypothetical protein
MFCMCRLTIKQKTIFTIMLKSSVAFVCWISTRSYLHDSWATIADNKSELSYDPDNRATKARPDAVGFRAKLRAGGRARFDSAPDPVPAASAT